MKKVDKLHFLTAGIPLRAKSSYQNAVSVLSDMKLDGMELEFVHGVRISDEGKKIVKENIDNNSLIFTAHAPFYINLSSLEKDKVKASVSRIIETVNVAQELGAYSITFHAAFYSGQDKELVYKNVKNSMDIINDEIKDISVWVRPETTGKATQWGDLDEIIKLSNECKNVLPCVDFSHIHARSIGGYNTYDDFCNILEKIGTEIGQHALDNFHAHIAGIEYTNKGERKHLNLSESDMNYKNLLKAMKKFDIKGAVVCESPNIEDDALLLKSYYESL